jgi:hypothetical protein
METLYDDDEANIGFSLGWFPSSKGNERLPYSLAHTLLLASPYLVVHAVHQVQQYATAALLHPPNILHQAQCDPTANIGSTSPTG